MEVQRGQVVRSLAGHDKGGFLAVVQSGAPLRLCVRRETPPPGAAQAEKKLFHLAPTATVLPEEALRTNRQIRSALRRFAGSAENA